MSVTTNLLEINSCQKSDGEESEKIRSLFPCSKALDFCGFRFVSLLSTGLPEKPVTLSHYLSFSQNRANEGRW